MGIKGLNKLINYYASSAISQKHISEFRGSKIAIDSEILIHKYRSIECKNSHIFGFLNNIYWHLENGIIPVYVFDGRPSNAKQNNVLAKRSISKEQINNKIEQLENKFIEQLDNINTNGITLECNILNPEINDTLDQLRKNQRRMNFMTVGKNQRNECKYLLKLMGIPFIAADQDAEAFCVTLQKKGIVDYVYTEDTDIIPYFIASLNPDEKVDIKILRKGDSKSMITVIDLNEIIIRMSLSQASFIDMCILSGCDFCTTISHINNHMKAYDYIYKYKSIENLKNIMYIPSDFKYQDARDMFFKNYDRTIEKALDLGTIDTNGLINYLIDERQLNPYQIIDKYNKVYSNYKSNK